MSLISNSDFTLKSNWNVICVLQGSHRLFITGFKVFSRIIKVNNNNSPGYILIKARPPLPLLLAVRSS